MLGSNPGMLQLRHLMRAKGKLIDIGKNKIFVWGYSVFAHTADIWSLQKIMIWPTCFFICSICPEYEEYENAKIYADCKFVEVVLIKNYPKKRYWQKTLRMREKQKSLKIANILTYNFYGSWFTVISTNLPRKILRCLRESFWLIRIRLANSKFCCVKKETFQILRKKKETYFSSIYQSPFYPFWDSKSYPPYLWRFLGGKI
jgi:hypothetical protein